MKIPNEVKDYREICARIGKNNVMGDVKTILKDGQIKLTNMNDILRKEELVEIIKDKYLNYLSLDEQYDISFY